MKEPKKNIPNSGVLRLWADSPTQPRRELLVESYPNQKKEIEKNVAERFLRYLNERKSARLQITSESEHPDFICQDNRQEIALELMEIVSMRGVYLRTLNIRYSEELRKRLKLPNLHVEFCAGKHVRIPSPDTTGGQEIVKVIEDGIRKTQNNTTPPHGEIAKQQIPGHPPCYVYAISTNDEGLRKYNNTSIYFSLDAATYGVPCVSLSQQDYTNLEKNLEKKFANDYSSRNSSKNILLLYGFEARPDFTWLNSIVSKLNRVHKNSFHEVWYIKPYPNALDDIRQIFSL